MSNLLGLLGLVLIGVAVDQLTSLWWAVLFAGATLVAVAYAVHANFERANRP